jgi:hypothetical protein
MLNRSFSFPAGASMDEVEGLVGKGLDAMFDAFDAGEETSVVFYPSARTIEVEGLQETKKDDNSDNDNKNKNKNEDEMGDNDAAGGVLDGEELCLEYGENPCKTFLAVLQTGLSYIPNNVLQYRPLQAIASYVKVVGE